MREEGDTQNVFHLKMQWSRNAEWYEMKINQSTVLWSNLFERLITEMFILVLSLYVTLLFPNYCKLILAALFSLCVSLMISGGKYVPLMCM